jgi:hypothetical protein
MHSYLASITALYTRVIISEAKIVKVHPQIDFTIKEFIGKLATLVASNTLVLVPLIIPKQTI